MVPGEEGRCLAWTLPIHRTQLNYYCCLGLEWDPKVVSLEDMIWAQAIPRVSLRSQEIVLGEMVHGLNIAFPQGTVEVLSLLRSGLVTFR